MNTINVTSITDINNQSSQLRCHSGRHNISATVGFRSTVERRRVSWFIAWHGLQSATHDFHDCLTCANLGNAQHTWENTYVAQPTPGATPISTMRGSAISESTRSSASHQTTVRSNLHK
jgi:hypothetical protein